MKRTMTTFATMVLVTLSAGLFAQSKMTAEQKQEAMERYEAYREKLNLSEEQSAKVEVINTKFFEGLSGLRNSNDSKLSKYRKFKKLKDEKDKEMKAVLNDDQFKTYQEFQAEMKEEFKENRRNNKG